MKLLQNRRLWLFFLVAMLVAVAFVAYWPSPVDQPVQGQLAVILDFLHHYRAPRWFNYEFIEASANVALFVPLGFAGALAIRHSRWWQLGALGLLISGCIELGQLLFLHNRFASPVDLVTNTIGAVLGALLALLAVKKVGTRGLPATGP